MQILRQTKECLFLLAKQMLKRDLADILEQNNEHLSLENKKNKKNMIDFDFLFNQWHNSVQSCLARGC